MSARIEMNLVGTKEVDAMLSQFQGQPLQNRTRKALRAGVAVFRKEIRRRAVSGRYPRKFKATRTRSHRNPVGVSVSPGSPLSAIFEHGAGQHAISPRRGDFLASGQGEDPFFARGAVSHPGMAARPISGPAFDAKRREAENAVADGLFGGL